MAKKRPQLLFPSGRSAGPPPVKVDVSQPEPELGTRIGAPQKELGGIDLRPVSGV